MISGDKYRVRDRLATADMRLSVQVDVTAANGCYAVQLPPPPTPLAAWSMEPVELRLTECMLNELSALQVMEIRHS